MCPYDDVPPRTPFTDYKKWLIAKWEQWMVRHSRDFMIGTGPNGNSACLGERHCAIYPCSGLVEFSEEMNK